VQAQYLSRGIVRLDRDTPKMSGGGGSRGVRRFGAPTRLTLARTAAACVVAAAVVLVAGPADGSWLCVPLALAACAGTDTVRGGLGAAVAVLAVALVATTVVAHTGGGAQPALLAVVGLASAGVLTGVRERMARERDALRSSALTDPLTEIANRRSLLARAEYEIERHRRAQRSFALVILDLDGFKQLNDRFGHPAGDSLLRDVGDALERAMRAQDTVARFGGDEFCVLAPETDEGGIDRLAGRIADAVDGVTVGLETVHASLGVALFPIDGSAVADLLDAADQRLLEAKRRLGSGRRGQRRSAA
jgi:diguanylate cyclase (GGDEF)-like protein